MKETLNKRVKENTLTGKTQQNALKENPKNDFGGTQEVEAPMNKQETLKKPEETNNKKGDRHL